jgi:mannose-6-phosphate isomerase-like protein (cupin superfamily)
MSPSSTNIASREQFESCIATFRTRVPDWDAFADAREEGCRRAQMRYIGSGASGKPDTNALPAQHFTLSVMHVPVGQGNAAHTHEVEEVFFVLQGHVTVFMEPVDMQVMLGKAAPDLMRYSDPDLQRRQDVHLT